MSTYTLEEICTRLHSGKSIAASQVAAQGAYPVIGGNGMRGYTSTYNFEGDCAIIGRQGAACGNVRYFSGKAYMTEHAIIACTSPEHDVRYLSYLLSVKRLGNLSAQSAQPGLSVRTLSKLTVDMPALSEQRQIVELLGKLDDTIILNQRTNDYFAA